MTAARLYISGMDGMRFLGADPALVADDVERIAMRRVYERIVAEHEAAVR